ncbi:D-lysine 5,6-aminomutase alpha subunit [compost metagenome]
MHITIDTAKVAYGRELAQRIAKPMLEYFRSHSTLATERAALRLYGVDGVDDAGVPWPNRMVDALAAQDKLSRGASYWLAHAALTTGKSIQDAAIALAEGQVDLDAPIPEREVTAWADETAGRLLNDLLAKRRERQATRERLGKGPKPWRYLIVATGNIYEDVPQAVAAARAGADIIAVIRSTGQSLIDFVPYGETTEGTGGTYATGANFKLMREALDEVGEELGRYIQLTNYASGLCMPEITALAAQEGLDMLLNDAMYGILFRDINIFRTLCDQYFSRLICGATDIIINTGEDNYLTTADAFEQGHTVLASQFINEHFAQAAGMPSRLMGLGHAFEMNPRTENGLMYEIAMAQLVRQVFPEAPLKYMPPTKHITGDIFQAHAHNALFNLVSVLTHQEIHLIGILTEAIHTPFASDRFMALTNTNYVFNYAKDMGADMDFKEDGIVATRAREVLDRSIELLEEVERMGMVEAIGKGVFADVKRAPDGGKGYHGVFARSGDYMNPFMTRLERLNHVEALR